MALRSNIFLSIVVLFMLGGSGVWGQEVGPKTELGEHDGNTARYDATKEQTIVGKIMRIGYEPTDHRGGYEMSDPNYRITYFHKRSVNFDCRQVRGRKRKAFDPA